jgi:hypothetical protein
MHRAIIIGAMAMSLASVASVRAATTPAEKCAAIKQKAAAKKLTSKLKCFAKAAGKDEPVSFECLTKAEEKFEETFAKADATGGCVNVNDAAFIENGVDTLLFHLLDATNNPPCGFTSIFLLCGGHCPLGSSCQPLFSGGFLIACQCEPF